MNTLEQKYDYIGEFHQGVAIVVKNNLYGAILMGGHEIISPTYDYISTFKDGYAQAIRKGECKILDLSGRECKKYKDKIIAIPPKYDSVRDFKNGYACVELNGKWGAIDINGNEIFEPQFYYLSDFIGETAKYKKETNFWGYLNTKGFCSECNLTEPIIEPDGNLIIERYELGAEDSFAAFIGDEAPPQRVRINNDGQLIVYNGESLVALDKSVFIARDFVDGFSQVQDSTGGWGVVNSKGQIIIPTEYTWIQNFSENKTFGLSKKGNLCIISSNGTIIKEFNQYTNAEPFKNGFAVVYQLNNWSGLINSNGEVLIEPFDGYVRYTNAIHEFNIISSEGKRGYFNAYTKLFIKPIYRKITEVQKDFIKVEIDNFDKVGEIGECCVDFTGRSFINRNPRIYFPNWCLGAKKLTEDIYIGISDTGKFGLMDAEGNTICQPLLDTICGFIGSIITIESHVSIKENLCNFKYIKKIPKYGLYNLDSKILIPAIYEISPEFKDDYYLISDKGLYGVINKVGDTILKPEWKNINYSKGYYIVSKDIKDDYTEKECFGLIDNDGNIIFNAKYTEIVVVKKELYQVKKDSQWYLYNDKGMLTKESFDDMTFDGTLFHVCKDELKGFLNEAGKKVILTEDGNYVELPSKFFWGYGFKNGIAKVLINGYENYVDNSFNLVLKNKRSIVIINEKIDYIVNKDFSDNYIFVSNEKYGLISKKGKIIIEPVYDFLSPLSPKNYVAAVLKEDGYNKLYGVIDSSNKTILAFDYSSIEPFRGKIPQRYTGFDCYGVIYDSLEYIEMPKIIEYWLIYKNGYGLIDCNGNICIPPEYKDIKKFENGFFLKKEDKYEVVATDHSVICEPKYDTITSIKNGFWKVSIIKSQTYTSKLQVYGILDSSGKERLKPIYSSIQEVTEYNIAIGASIIIFCGEYGLVDENYNMLVIPQYRFMSEFNRGIALVEKLDYNSNKPYDTVIRGEIDYKGNFIEISELTEHDILNGKAKQKKTLSNGFIVYQKDNSNPNFQYCAVVNQENKIILPYKYHDIEELEEGSYCALVKEYNFNEFRTLDVNFNEVIINKESNESTILTEDTSRTIIQLNTIKINSDERICPYDPASEGIVWIYENNREKIGLATIDGEMLVEPCYGKVEPFVDGYAKVNNGCWFNSKSYEDYSYCIERIFREGKWGVINTLGKLVIPMEYDSIEIEESYFRVTKSILDHFNGWSETYIQVSGLLNKEGELIIKNEKGEYILANKKFDWQEDFNTEGRSKVYYKERIGYVNNKSQLIVTSLIVGTEIFDLIIPEEFDWGYYCSENYFIGMKNNKWGVFDYDGLVIIPAEYDSINFEDGVYLVHRNNKTGVLSETGDIIIKIEYDSITFEDGVYLVRRDNKTGILSEVGDIIIRIEFDSIEKIYLEDSMEKFYICTNQSTYGLYNYEGKELLPTKYKQIQFIGHELLAVQESNGKFRVCNVKGKCVNDISLDKIYLFGDRNKRDCFYNESKRIENALYTIVQKEGLYGAINSMGELVLPIRYNVLNCVNRNVFYGDYHYIDSYGRRVAFRGDEFVHIADDYDTAMLLENGLILVQQHRLYGCINKKGDIVIPIKYNDLSYSDNLFVASIYDESTKTLKYGVLNLLNNEVVPFNDKYTAIKIEKGLILYYVESYWGAFTLHGKLICEPKYSHIQPLTEYLIKVGIDYNNSMEWNYSNETYWGLINIDGKELLSIDRYNTKYTICDQLFNGFIEYYVNGNRIGYLDVTGRELLKPTYTKIGEFIDGYAIVAKTSYYNDDYGRDREKYIYGVMDDSFKEIIPCVFNRIEYEPESGLFKTDLGYKTPDGRFIAEVSGERLFIDAKYKYCEAFHNGSAIAVKIENGKAHYGLINKKSEDILPPIFQWLKLSDNGLYKFKINERYGFVDASGNIIISNRYHGIGKFKDNLACVHIKVYPQDQLRENEKLYGYIDSNGNEILSPTYEFIGKRYNKYSVVMKNNLWGLFGIENYQLITIPNVAFLGPYFDNRCKINVGGRYDKNNNKTVGGLWGYISINGKIIIKPIYELVYNFSDTMAAVKLNGKWGFINIEGAIIVPCEYDQVESSFKDGKGKLIKEGEVFVFDKSGKQIDSYVQEKQYLYDAGYEDDTPSIYDNPYYNDNLDMDQQSIEFWNNF